jgi:hypothetical protein
LFPDDAAAESPRPWASSFLAAAAAAAADEGGKSLLPFPLNGMRRAREPVDIVEGDEEEEKNPRQTVPGT